MIRWLAFLLLLAVPASAEDSRAIDATVLLFDDGLASASADDPSVFPAVRRIEAVVLSYALSRRLRASDAFSVVRLAARPDELTELTVTGQIVTADGLKVAVDVEARDSLGDQWLSRRFEAMDRFRARALHRLLLQAPLDDDDFAAAESVLRQKLDILLKGARKHGNQALIDEFEPMRQAWLEARGGARAC